VRNLGCAVCNLECATSVAQSSVVPVPEQKFFVPVPEQKFFVPVPEQKLHVPLHSITKQ